jgi:hypothetical protein
MAASDPEREWENRERTPDFGTGGSIPGKHKQIAKMSQSTEQEEDSKFLARMRITDYPVRDRDSYSS